MGISGAFLTELAAQRATAVRELRAARWAADDGAAAVALARLRDLDELLARSGSSDVRLDAEVFAHTAADVAS
jgi:hypothetical protein